MQGIHRQIHTSQFFYKASRVPHQLRVSREVATPIAHDKVHAPFENHRRAGDKSECSHLPRICGLLFGKVVLHRFATWEDYICGKFATDHSNRITQSPCFGAYMVNARLSDHPHMLSPTFSRGFEGTLVRTSRHLKPRHWRSSTVIDDNKRRILHILITFLRPRR